MSPVPWIRLYVSFLDHPKTRKLRRELGTVEPILRLWFWAADCCPSGDITDQTVDDIEDSAHWRGDRGKAFKAMQDAGFIEQCTDRLILHGWNEKTGAGVESLNRARALTTVRQQRYRNTHGNALLDGLRTTNEETTGEERREEDRKEEKKEDPPIVPHGGTGKRKPRAQNEYSEAFSKAWKLYVRGEDKAGAYREWKKLVPQIQGGEEGLLDKISSALSWQIPAWRKSDNAFPNHQVWFTRYLSHRRWEDEKPSQHSLLSRPATPPRKTYEPKGDYAAEAAADPERAKPDEQDAEAQRALAELTQRLAGHTTQKET